ncbi:hypothetical protein ALC60_13994, partial [Trachymyrmex zeteki]
IIEKWKLVCKENFNPKTARVCSEHFHHSQFEDQSWLKDLIGESGNIRVRLKRDVVPLAAIENNQISMDNDLEADVAQPVAHCSFNPDTDCAASTSASSCATQIALNTAVVPNFDISQEMQKLYYGQIQLGMAVLNLKFTYFVICSSFDKECYTLKIERNDDFIFLMLNKLKKVYYSKMLHKVCLLKKVCDKNSQ